MNYYSFVVLAQEEVAVPECFQLLGPGVNVFTVALKLEDVENFKQGLVNRGLVIKQCNKLNDDIEVTPRPCLADGDSVAQQFSFMLPVKGNERSQ